MVGVVGDGIGVDGGVVGDGVGAVVGVVAGVGVGVVGITQSPESTNFALDLHFLSRPSLFDTKPSLQVGVQKA